MKKLVWLPLILFCSVLLAGCSAKNLEIVEKGNSMTQTPTPTAVPTPTMATLPPPTMKIDPKKSYTAILKTAAGDIKIQLNAKTTPITVNNFVYLAKNHFYDNTVFHRTIKDFMIQGGDPKGDGTGGPGYQFDDEPFQGSYTRGTVAMANAGPNTNGSQFFIIQEDYPLSKNYVIFGKVIDGLEVVDQIASAGVGPNPYTQEMSKPLLPVTVSSVEILEK